MELDSTLHDGAFPVLLLLDATPRYSFTLSRITVLARPLEVLQPLSRLREVLRCSSR